MELETRVCGSCGTESVIFVDGVYACESCGRIDDTGDAIFESEPLGVSIREQEEGVNTSSFISVVFNKASSKDDQPVKSVLKSC